MPNDGMRVIYMYEQVCPGPLGYTNEAKKKEGGKPGTETRKAKSQRDKTRENVDSRGNE